MEFIDALRGHGPSYVWRSMWGEKAFLLDGIKWRVGNGSQIKVWDKAWPPGESSFIVPTPNVNNHVDVRVEDLIDSDKCIWNMNALKNNFTEEDIEKIKEIPLSNKRPHDVRFWWPTNDGIYTTQSKYWLGRLGHLRGWAQRYGGDYQTMWKGI